MQISTSYSQQEIEKMLEAAFDTNIPDDPGLRTYFFTNDKFLGEIKKFVESHAPATNSDPNACALIVGSGGALNMLDILPRTIIFTDKNTDLLIWLYFVIETIKKETDLKRAKYAFGLHDFGDNLDRLPSKLIEHEQESFGDRHYLANQKNYESTRLELSKHNFVYTNIDYSNGLELATLAQILKINDSFITIANMTNLHPYLSYEKRYHHLDDILEEELLSFNGLPFDKNTLFITRPLDEKDYFIEPLIGVSSYLSAIRELIRDESAQDYERWMNSSNQRS